MSVVALNYEVTVEVKGRKQGHHIMFHFFAKHPNKAAEKGSKYGRVLSVRKVSSDNVIRDIEQMKIPKPPKPQGLYIGCGLYEDNIDLDKMLGLRRAKRIDVNKRKDKALTNE